MKKLNSTLLISAIFSLFISCKKETAYSQLTYNEKANELIQQIIIDDSCGCILEIPQESMIKSSIIENPSFDIKQEIIKKNHLKNTIQLDSLEKVSEKFILDTILLRQKNIKIIKRNSISDIIKDKGRNLLKKCPNGVLCFSKPIIDERNKTAVLFYKQMATCIGSPIYLYKYEDKKWIYGEPKF
ncbi:hypothetical protein GKZ90_0017260 [Flavobacterium sp. MC2016-06]|uniref:hypothetical protein n=1 Tax=Flavobacterium sp. MC2016-06 TaxID=2676308 RepID=UPI0012BAFADC|nr:hypothetical protein [Flavobacterium sp. MC2016-06]MBU3861990.1 hypothetical protein [Flavobacterium sp. MC2016-06]